MQAPFGKWEQQGWIGLVLHTLCCRVWYLSVSNRGVSDEIIAESPDLSRRLCDCGCVILCKSIPRPTQKPLSYLRAVRALERPRPARGRSSTSLTTFERGRRATTDASSPRPFIHQDVGVGGCRLGGCVPLCVARSARLLRAGPTPVSRCARPRRRSRSSEPRG